MAGIDFDKTHAPVVRIQSVRALLALAAHKDFSILHVDFDSTFLNGENDVELYVQQPEGVVDKRFPDMVLRQQITIRPKVSATDMVPSTLQHYLISWIRAVLLCRLIEENEKLKIE